MDLALGADPMGQRDKVIRWRVGQGQESRRDNEWGSRDQPPEEAAGLIPEGRGSGLRVGQQGRPQMWVDFGWEAGVFRVVISVFHGFGFLSFGLVCGDEAGPEVVSVSGDFNARLGFVHGYYDSMALLLVQTNVWLLLNFPLSQRADVVRIGKDLLHFDPHFEDAFEFADEFEVLGFFVHRFLSTWFMVRGSTLRSRDIMPSGRFGIISTQTTRFEKRVA
jgi:hypothetical protein